MKSALSSNISLLSSRYSSFEAHKKFGFLKYLKWYEKFSLGYKKELEFISNIENKYKDDIDIEMTYWKDLQIMGNELTHYNKTKQEKIEILKRHYSYNPIAKECIRAKYSQLEKFLYSIPLHGHNSRKSVFEDHFIPNYETIREKYESGELYGDDLYIALSTYTEFYKIKLKATFEFAFGKSQNLKLSVNEIKREFPGEFNFLPNNKFKKIELQEYKDLKFRGKINAIQKPKGLHSYLLLDESGTSRIYLETNTHDFSRQVYGNTTIFEPLDFLGIKNVVIEGIYSFYDKETDRYLDINSNDAANNKFSISSNKSHNYDMKKIKINFYAYDIFSIDELIEGKIKDPYSVRIKNLNEAIGWYDSPNFNICEIASISDKPQLSRLINMCRQIGYKSHWDEILLISDNDKHNGDIHYIDLDHKDDHYILLNKLKKKKRFLPNATIKR